jgi:alpha-beta hydrolase superfamily lysophospholipase
MTPIEQTVKSVDGTELAVYKWSTTGKASAAQLVVSHGYLEHAMRYAEFAQVLATKHGISVTVYDYRGHGKSGGSPGFVKKWKDYHDDLDAVLTTVEGDTPTFVLGHSNGGLVCLDYFSKNTDTRVQGLIICSPWLGPAASKLLGNIFPKLKLPVSKDEAGPRVLTHDPVKIKEHEDDKLNLTKLTVGWAYQSLLAQARVTTECKQISIPIMYAYAELDRVADPLLNKKFGQLLAADDKTILERKGCHHEILNEIDRDELYGIFAEWIMKRV